MIKGNDNPFLKARKPALNEPDPQGLKNVVGKAQVRVEAKQEPQPAAQSVSTSQAKKTSVKRSISMPRSRSQQITGNCRVQTYVTEEIDEALKFLSKADERSVAYIVRQHLDVDTILKKAKEHGFSSER